MVKRVFHVINKQSFVGTLFFLLSFFSWVPNSLSITFEPLYIDAPRTGFYDRSSLTPTEKTLFLAGGNNAQTLGEARRNAFEAVLNQFELWFVGNSTVRVQASFQNLEPDVLASSKPGNIVYNSSSLEPTGIPIALAENISEDEINSTTEADIVIIFNERRYFDYGLNEETFRRPFGPAIFVLIAIHEFFHGMGFFELIRPDGSFPLVKPTASDIRIKSIYDLNLYSERDDELLINLFSNDQRQRALTSVTGLLWDGTGDGTNNYSCAQIAGKAQTDLLSPYGVDSEGRIRLYAPAVWKQGGSVSHLVESTVDIMKPSYGSLTHVQFTLGILRDIGWKLNRDNVKPFVTEEFLERCTISTERELEPRQDPKPEQELEPRQERETKSSGCAVAETNSAATTTTLNLFGVLFIILLSVFSKTAGKFLISFCLRNLLVVSRSLDALRSPRLPRFTADHARFLHRRMETCGERHLHRMDRLSTTRTKPTAGHRQ